MRDGDADIRMTMMIDPIGRLRELLRSGRLSDLDVSWRSGWMRGVGAETVAAAALDQIEMDRYDHAQTERIIAEEILPPIECALSPQRQTVMDI